MCLTAEVNAVAADQAIELLAGFDLDWRDVTVARTSSIRPLGWHHRERSQDSDAHVWAEVVGRADENSELAATYLMFMIAAGVIAGIGVLTGSSVLVVGAMAISPDLLPISASAIGLVDHRWHLAARAGRALIVGLITGAAAAFTATAIVRVVGRVPDDLVLADTVLGPSLTELGPGSVLVAVAAGVAGMLAFERAGGSGRRCRHLRDHDPCCRLRRRRHRTRAQHTDVGCPRRVVHQRGCDRRREYRDAVVPTPSAPTTHHVSPPQPSLGAIRHRSIWAPDRRHVAVAR